jgi:hypothetical protein
MDILASYLNYDKLFIHFVMNPFASRVLRHFFAACFLGIQLFPVDDFEPVLQDPETFYAVEVNGIDWSSAAISTFVYPSKHAKIKTKLVSQNAQLSLQRQHQFLIE